MDIPEANAVVSAHPELKEAMLILCSHQLSPSTIATYNWVVKVSLNFFLLQSPAEKYGLQ